MMKRIRFFIAILLTFVTFNVWAADLSISLDKKSASIADVVYLTVIYTGDKKIAPELDSLQKDFRIVSNSTSSQINFINGAMSQSKKWTFGLVPLHTGKIRIAPLRLDNLISNSAELEVTDISDVAFAPDKRENSNSPFFKIEQKTDAKQPYVQQQMMLYINIYDSVGMQEGGLIVDEESKKDWIIIPINEHPVIRQDTIDNRRMNVLTYVYAIFPQKSGEIMMPQITFDGYYVRNSEFTIPGFGNTFMSFGIDLNDVFGQKVPVHMKTKTEKINILPIPDGYSAKNWLPLSQLELSATWSVKQGFKVGEAVSRTIELKAIGMMEGMLPQIDFGDLNGLKQYPEKPTFEQKIENGKIVTTAQYNNVYIPTKSGEITIPEIKLQWFNVINNQFEVAVVPEENIFVLPNPEIAAEIKNSENTQEITLQKSDSKTENLKENKTEPIQKKNKADVVSLLKSLFETYCFVFIIGIFSILFLFLCAKRKKKYLRRNAIIYALKKHDYKKAKEALLDWARYKFYPEDINNFNDISCLIKNDAFSEQLSIFNKFLYSSNAEYFDATKFVEILKKVDKLQYKKEKNSEVLPNLYD